MSRLPLIGVTTCSRQVGLHADLISGDHCFRAAATAAPGMLSSLADPVPPSDILDAQAGILFASLPLNVELFHEHHQGTVQGADAVHDAAREAQWAVSSNPHYLAIFQAFGDACRARAIQRDADASNHA